MNEINQQNTGTETASLLRLKAETATLLNFAARQNSVPVVRRITVENGSSQPAEGLKLRIYSSSDMIVPFERELPAIPAGESLLLRSDGGGVLASAVTVDAEALSSLTERITTTLVCTLCRADNGEVLCEERSPLTLLAFDEWQGYGYYPELLAAFVLPNSPALAPLLSAASSLLGKWTDDPSLNGYQSRDPAQARRQVAALYGALQNENIVYSVPPASFEEAGQRIRLCDNVLSRKMGTCLDLTLLFAAGVEAMGLHPLLILQKGHAFLGVWLEDTVFPETVTDDPSALTKRLAAGVSELTVVECTAFCAGMSMNFEHAVRLGTEKLAGLNTVECIIDVSRARLCGIRPLPVRVRQEDGSYSFQAEKKEEEITPEAPKDVEISAPVASSEGEKISRIESWERRLLDLSLRNTLLNLRLTGTTVPLLSLNVADTEDALADGESFTILPFPSDLDGDRKPDFETAFSVSGYESLLAEDFKNKRLLSLSSEQELTEKLQNLYRRARSSIEESGVNTLYLACGFLRWYEEGNSTRPLYAPLVLIPVDLVRRSVRTGYRLRLRDEETVMNITLLELLRRDFGISVDGLDPLPTDEKGADIRAAFTAVRQAVMNRTGWDIIEGACLGIFSFARFVMWNDLRNRADDLAASPVVRSLMNGTAEDFPYSGILERDPDEGSVFSPLSADSSQLRAIAAAAKGESFVLHGPPGTGKSQTITSLIANALAEGKTVLFVAEKMAALSVVDKRLNKLGLGNFCLELHSDKAKKSAVLEQLKAAVEAAEAAEGPDYEKEAETAASLRRELDSYAKALHKEQSCGLSAFDLIDLAEGEKDSPDGVLFDPETAFAFTPEDRKKQRLLAERLLAAGKGIGHPHLHPLRAVTKTEYDPQVRDELPEAAGDLEKTLGEYLSSVAGLREKLLSAGIELPEPVTEEEHRKMADGAEAVLRWENIPDSWSSAEDLAQVLEGIRNLAPLSGRLSSLREGLLAEYAPSFLSLDGKALYESLRGSDSAWFLKRFFLRRSLRRQIVPHAFTASGKKNWEKGLERLKDYLELRDKTLPLYEQFGSYAYLSEPDEAVKQELLLCCGTAKNVSDTLRSLSGSDDLRRKAVSVPEIRTACALVKEARSAYDRSYQKLFSLIGTDPAPYGTDFVSLRTMCADLAASASSLRDWQAYAAVRSEASAAGLSPLVKAYEDGLEHEGLLPAYRKGLYTAMAKAAISSEPALKGFSGKIFSETVAQLARLDSDLRSATVREIYCRLAARLPKSGALAHSSEMNLLQKAIRGSGRGLSIRKLFSDLPNLLSRLCPCMLMSPLSAARYLDPKRTPFDIVVFDEASQIQTCEAVGALARGRSAVIVGDPKQMPPTTFFMANQNGSSQLSEEEDFETEDLESILDDCLALGMPQSHLLWHYRSRHESLIAFSNGEFYDNRLLTFPSVNDLQTKVRFCRVDGCFDRGKSRRNPEEARAVVTELHRRSLDPEKSAQSVGVVTFNIAQQSLIEDMLDEVCRRDPDFETWINSGEEPLFVKNLENVQGDERDCILISVGYGVDKEGRISMNFGPLNRDGGWRRLNVAVTRARSEMTVFSSLTADRIDMNRTGARGVAALKDFLAYAERGTLPPSSSVSLSSESGGLKKSIAEVLEKAGFQTRTNVGRSGYRVDLGVIDPADPGCYLCGILTDGASYAAAGTVTERELSQRSVLEGLGWTLFRVWSLDWWDDPERESAELLEKVRAMAEENRKRREALAEAEKELLSGMTAETASPESTEVLPEDEAPSAEVPPEPEVPVSEENTAEVPSKAAFRVVSSTVSHPYYTPCELPFRRLSADQFLSPKSDELLLETFEQVLEAEAPITEHLLIKRALNSFGLVNTGSRIPVRCDALLASLGRSTTENDGIRVFWNSATPDSFTLYRVAGEGESRRDPIDLPPEETALALAEVLSSKVEMPETDLIKEASRKLGYSRPSAALSLAMQRGLSLLADAGRVSAEDGIIRSNVH